MNQKHFNFFKVEEVVLDVILQQCNPVLLVTSCENFQWQEEGLKRDVLCLFVTYIKYWDIYPSCIKRVNTMAVIAAILGKVAKFTICYNVYLFYISSLTITYKNEPKFWLKQILWQLVIPSTSTSKKVLTKFKFHISQKLLYFY